MQLALYPGECQRLKRLACHSTGGRTAPPGTLLTAADQAAARENAVDDRGGDLTAVPSAHDEDRLK
jgi:hypothetical protein